MPTQLPAITRPTCPDSIIELAFQRLEALCPYQDLLIDEARKLTDCVTGGKLRKARAEGVVGIATAVPSQPDVQAQDISRFNGVLSRAAFAQSMLDHDRVEDAVFYALSAVAESIPLRQGEDDGKRALWVAVIERVAAARRMQ